MTPKTSPEGHDRRDVPRSCRARSPALRVGGRDRVALHGHVHRARMLICMHNWGSSLHLPPHRRSSIIVIGICTHSRSRVPRGCRRQRRRDQLVLRERGRSRIPAETRFTRRRHPPAAPLGAGCVCVCRLSCPTASSASASWSRSRRRPRRRRRRCLCCLCN